MGKRPVRKRFKHKKRHIDGVPTFSTSRSVTEYRKSTVNNGTPNPASDEICPPVSFTAVCSSTEMGGLSAAETENSTQIEFETRKTCSTNSAAGEGTSGHPCNERGIPFGTSGTSEAAVSEPIMCSSESKISEEFSSFTLLCKVPMELLVEVKSKLDGFLPQRLIAIAQQTAVHVCFLSPHSNLSIQRTLVFFPNGGVELYVHHQLVSVERYLCDVIPPTPLVSGSVNSFVDRAISIVNKVREMEVCSGFDVEKYKSVWSSCPFGKVDENPYDESRYIETFRSNTCQRLVHPRKWRCSECSKLYHPLRRRFQSAAVQPSPFTNNAFLTEQQKLKKLADQHRELEITKKKLARLRHKMQDLIKKQAVQVDQSLSDDLTNILRDKDLTPAQHIFLQEQVKASQQKNMVGMRWHPTMIRFALALHLTSPAAYELVRDTGMVKLPSSRTLFDYSHARPLKDGIDEVVLASVTERVLKVEKPRRYLILMADEMHITQNLVFQKSTGRLIGYTKLDNLDKEVEIFNKHLDNPDQEVEETIASKVLVYMVKGVAVGIKEVIATYPVANPSTTQMYMWTWQVIGALERSGVPIIAFVCDGFSTNRAFIKMHKPASKLTKSGIIFDTINKAAPHRTLYFISDVPHLLKTLRNCFMNSRWDKKQSRRHMVFNGKKISWDFIIKLYESQKCKSLRKTFKLNAMNVYPDSYARMKVKYAAEIISLTVAKHLEDMKWDDASETIAFIIMFNNWFDCLNGAHSSIANRRRKPNVSPYTKDVLGDNPKDKRFEFLDSVIEHLYKWREQAYSQNANITMNTSTTANTHADNDESEIFEGTDESDDKTPHSRRILSRETLEGIEMSTLAIKGAISFLLEEGVEFINARVFTQDPLEQHFSKIRAGQGGSTHPNYFQTLTRNRALHTIGQLGIKKRKGNSGECVVSSDVTSQPLLKRQSNRKPKFIL